MPFLINHKLPLMALILILSLLIHSVLSQTCNMSPQPSDLLQSGIVALTKERSTSVMAVSSRVRYTPSMCKSTTQCLTEASKSQLVHLHSLSHRRLSTKS